MLKHSVDGSTIHIETDALKAQICTEGYTSGVSRGTLVDKKMGATDLGRPIHFRSDEKIHHLPCRCGLPRSPQLPPRLGRPFNVPMLTGHIFALCSILAGEANHPRQFL